jgi:hypothetical protein
MVDAPSSEVQNEDVVIQIVCRKISVKQTHGQRSELCVNRTVWIPVNQSHLVPLRVAVRSIVGELRARIVTLVDDAWKIHRQIGWRLEIYIRSTKKALQ